VLEPQLYAGEGDTPMGRASSTRWCGPRAGLADTIVRSRVSPGPPSLAAPLFGAIHADPTNSCRCARNLEMRELPHAGGRRRAGEDIQAA